jgi:hypothetical protein
MKIKKNLSNYLIKSLGCRMPAWKQGHAKIFHLSPNNALRKKIKVMGASFGYPLRQVYT